MRARAWVDVWMERGCGWGMGILNVAGALKIWGPFVPCPFRHVVARDLKPPPPAKARQRTAF